jgi:two-component system, OmpR family, response regulator
MGPGPRARCRSSPVNANGARQDRMNSSDMSVTGDGVIRILNIIDDLVTRAFVTRILQQYGMHVTSTDPDGLARHLQRNDLDLIILDLRQGRREKLILLSQIVALSIPVIITDNHRSAVSDRVAALEFGADDYVTEPIAPRELVARVRSILRRRGRSRRIEPHRSEMRGYQFGDLTLDLRTRHLTRSDGARVSLSSREYALLLAFLDKPYRTFTRQQLLRMTKLHQDATDRSIDVLVLRLRRKLEGHPRTKPIIETKRGLGYTMNIAVERLK